MKAPKEYLSNEQNVQHTNTDTQIQRAYRLCASQWQDGGRCSSSWFTTDNAKTVVLSVISWLLGCKSAARSATGRWKRADSRSRRMFYLSKIFRQRYKVRFGFYRRHFWKCNGGFWKIDRERDGFLDGKGNYVSNKFPPAICVYRLSLLYVWAFPLPLRLARAIFFLFMFSRWLLFAVGKKVEEVTFSFHGEFHKTAES